MSCREIIERKDPCSSPEDQVDGWFVGMMWHPSRKTVHLGVSKNNGIPKSSILIGFSIINHPFWGTPIFGNTNLQRSIKNDNPCGRHFFWDNVLHPPLEGDDGSEFPKCHWNMEPKQKTGWIHGSQKQIQHFGHQNAPMFVANSLKVVTKTVAPFGVPWHCRCMDGDLMKMRWRLVKCSNVYQGLRSFFLWKWTTIKNPAMLVVPQHFFASLVIKWRLLSSIFKDSPRSDLKVWCNTIPGSPAQRLQILISPSKVCCANLVLLCAAFYFGQGVPERSILCFFFPIKETGTWIMWTWKTKDHGQDGHHPKWAPSFSK